MVPPAELCPVRAPSSTGSHTPCSRDERLLHGGDARNAHMTWLGAALCSCPLDARDARVLEAWVQTSWRPEVSRKQRAALVDAAGISALRRIIGDELRPVASRILYLFTSAACARQHAMRLSQMLLVEESDIEPEEAFRAFVRLIECRRDVFIAFTEADLDSPRGRAGSHELAEMHCKVALMETELERARLRDMEREQSIRDLSASFDFWARLVISEVKTASAAEAAARTSMAGQFLSARSRSAAPPQRYHGNHGSSTGSSVDDGARSDPFGAFRAAVGDVTAPSVFRDAPGVPKKIFRDGKWIESPSTSAGSQPSMESIPSFSLQSEFFQAVQGGGHVVHTMKDVIEKKLSS